MDERESREEQSRKLFRSSGKLGVPAMEVGDSWQALERTK